MLFQKEMREKLKEEMGWDVMMRERRKRRVKWLYSGWNIELVAGVKGRLKSQPLDLIV
jgi:hypothetical protein